MTPQDLKNSILQLAIQGKLVEQRPEEGSAEDLYRQIQAEKHRLVKAGKIKKEKPLPEIAEDEIPFEIPESWKWCYIGELFQHNTGKALNASDKAGMPMTYITTSNLYWNRFELDHLKEMPFTEDEIEKCTVQKGDLLVCEGGDFGRAAIWSYDFPMRIQNHIHRLRSYGNLSIPYFYYIFHLYKNAGMISGKGIAIQGLSSKALHRLVVPLPPLPEQRRIVAKIEEFQPLIDRYAEAWTQLEAFNKRFPEDMQKSLLQLAIQGKLVEQRPEEGTGEELYRKILATKNTKKGKKEKPLPPITEDEIPFDIPESWKWYRIGELFKIVNGFTPLKTKPEFWTNGDIPWFTIEDVHRQGRFITSTEKFITRSALAKGTERIVPADTVLLCCTASVGEYAYTKIPLTTNQQFNAFVVKPHCQSAVCPLYVFEFVKTLKGNLIDRAGKTTFNFVSVGKLSNMLIPLPPLAEQKRIVAKLEELLPLCERLK